MIPNNLRVINIGLRFFYQSLTEQKVETAHVNWEPKPKLEKDIEDILDKIDSDRCIFVIAYIAF